MTEIKAWQKGYDLDYLLSIEKRYENYNKFAVSPFTQYKKHHIARDLYEQKLFVGGDISYVLETVKVASNITMHGDVVIGRKIPGDVVVTKIAGSLNSIHFLLETLNYANTWVYVWAEDEFWKYMLIGEGFQYIGGKVTSHGEIYGIYFRNKEPSLYKEQRQHPEIHPVEKINIKKIADVRKRPIQDIVTIISKLDLQFANHYSNYNKNKAWSALSLRGYSPDWTFIENPDAMSKQWKEKHQGDNYFLQDTKIYSHFPVVYEVLQYFFDGPTHRVRFMKLQPGGGELERHTDQVDKQIGSAVGDIARFHFPIVTNENMIFSSWDWKGNLTTHNMKVGELWYLDIRKPHQAINNGEQERIHLVVDVEMTPKIQEMIVGNQ